MTRLVTVTEANFSRQVLASSTPILLLFGKRTCPGSRAMATVLTQLSPVYAEQLRIAQINVDTAPLLVELYGIWATPTLIVFQYGEVLTRVVGFLPEGLVHVLIDQGIGGALPENAVWSPVEEVFENTVLVPLLHRAGLHFQRQVACSLSGTNQSRGRIDILLYDHPSAQPISLIESKRQITSEYQLQQAVRQASAYAQALSLRAFIVAAPSGMWIFQRDGAKAQCVQTFTSLELHHKPDLVYRSLTRLRQGQ